MRVLWLIQRSDFIDPMGICYLSAAGKEAGHQMDLVVIEETDVFQRIKEYKPNLIAYSAVTGEHQGYFNLNRKIKEQFPEVFTIMGGAHATYYPQCLEYQPIDAIVVGEGEGAFVELLNRLETKIGIGDVLNIGTKANGVNRKRDLIGDLDSLPFPDRDLLFANTQIGKFPLKTFITSRGCPFPCTYCFEPVLKKMYRDEQALGPLRMLDEKTGRQSGKYERRHSPERVCEEILRVKSRWPVEFVKFEDDLFILHADKWLYEFVKIYPKQVGIPFNALVRVDSINEEMLKLLKEAGCVSLNIAVDSANIEIRKRVIKKKFTNEDVIKRFRMAESYGIYIFNNMILGLPDSNIEDDKEAVRLDIQSGVRFASFSILMPYPGTEIGRYCEKRGYFKMDPDNMGESLLERSPLSCFTEAEKNQQKNILYLGGLALLIGNFATWSERKSRKYQKFLKQKHLSVLCHVLKLLEKCSQKICEFSVEFILNTLTRIFKPNRVFMAISYMVKVITLKYYIYPINFGSILSGIKNFIKGFKIEVIRTMPEMKKTVTYPASKPF